MRINPVRYQEYRDKHGNLIRPGCTIRHESGEFAKVHLCGGDEEVSDLGIPANKEETEFYPLSELYMKEWEIFI